jgi:hypothetical protein
MKVLGSHMRNYFKKADRLSRLPVSPSHTLVLIFVHIFIVLQNFPESLVFFSPFKNR